MKIFFFLILNLIICSNSAFAANREVYVAKYKHDKICAISYTFDDGQNIIQSFFQNWKNGVLKELFGYAAIIRNREWMQRFLE